MCTKIENFKETVFLKNKGWLSECRELLLGIVEKPVFQDDDLTKNSLQTIADAMSFGGMRVGLNVETNMSDLSKSVKFSVTISEKYIQDVIRAEKDVERAQERLRELTN